LAVAALRHIGGDPCRLHGVAGFGRAHPFDGGDFLSRHTGDRQYARPRGRPIHVHGAGSAQRFPAAVLGARHIQHVPQYPEQRHVGVHIDLPNFSVDDELLHQKTP